MKYNLMMKKTFRSPQGFLFLFIFKKIIDVHQKIRYYYYKGGVKTHEINEFDRF
jgi:hypothetical protein